MAIWCASARSSDTSAVSIRTGTRTVSLLRLHGVHKYVLSTSHSSDSVQIRYPQKLISAVLLSRGRAGSVDSEESCLLLPVHVGAYSTSMLLITANKVYLHNSRTDKPMANHCTVIHE